MVFLRLAGQETSLEIVVTDSSQITDLFKRRYKQVYGHYLMHRQIEVESIRVLVREGRNTGIGSHKQRRRYTPVNTETNSLVGARATSLERVYLWETLTPGAHIQGPALVISKNSTTYVQQNWAFDLDPNNNGILALFRNKHKNVRKTRR
ncbi:MAG: hypothetical protein QM762_00020 [Chryseolinea sp.]